MVLPVPVGDDLGPKGFPWLVGPLCASCLVLFVLARYVQPDSGRLLVETFAASPKGFWAAWAELSADPTRVLAAPGAALQRLLLPIPGHLFLHIHELQLCGNLAFLWVFGRALEKRLGPLGFLVLFFLGAFLALGAHLVLEPDSGTPLVGATGAVAALLGAYFVTWPRARIRVWVFIVFVIPCEAPVGVFLLSWFLFQLLNSLPTLLALGGAEGHVYWAHLGAFVAGMLLVLLLRGRRREGGPPPHR